MSGGGDPNKTAIGAANGNNCLSNGEPGREVPKVYDNAEDNLNFGWFSLPRDGQNSGGSRHGSRPASVSGRKQNGRTSRQGGIGHAQHERPPSQKGSIQQQRPVQVSAAEGSETHLPPSSRQGHLPQQPGDSQRLVVSDDPDVAEFERPDQNNYQQEQQMCFGLDQCRGQGDDSTGHELRPEIEAVDWPLSRAAQEMFMTQAHPPAEPGFNFLDKKGMSSRPGSRGGTPSVPPIPPTPMPPLQWNGYKGTNRPTFASWRERWHRDHAQSHPHCPVGRNRMETEQHNILSDFNNNNNIDSRNTGAHCGLSRGNTVKNKCTSKDRNKNSNNNSCDGNYVIKDESLDLRENQGSYWNKHWREDHITNIGTEFIGYDGSIFRSVKGSGQSKTAAPKGNEGNKSFPTCNMKEINMAFRKRMKKWASTVDPIVQTNGKGLGSYKSEKDARREDFDFETEGPPKHVKSANRKSSFTLNFLSRVKGLKEAASCWGKKVGRRSLPRSNYCQLFDNDF